MSTFEMGFKNLFVFTALLLIWKTCRVYGQAARVEYINQPYSPPLATTVQTAPQLVVPAIVKPIITPYDSYIQETAPCVPNFNGFNGYPNFLPSYPTPMSPIIIDDDDDDNWHHLLYFLIFAMKNKRNSGPGYWGGCNGGWNCNCGCCGGCNCGCGCNNGCGSNCGCGCGCGGNYLGGYDNNCLCGCGNCCNCGCGCGCSYIPYPIPFPIGGPYPYNFPGFGSLPDATVDDTYQTGANEINLIIRTDQTCSC